MSCAGSVDSEVYTGFPRVSGDEPVTSSKQDANSSFSPRERG